MLWLQGWGFEKYNRSADNWIYIDPNVNGVGSRAPILRYSPACKCVFLMGGVGNSADPSASSHAVYRYDQNGVLTRLKDSPAAVNIYVSASTAATDPLSGNIIILISQVDGATGNITGPVQTWEYNVTNDAWSHLNITVPTGWMAQDGSTFAVVSSPISKYGVIMYMSGAGGASKVYLYKHAAGTGVTPSRCDLNGSGSTDVVDMQTEVNAILAGTSAASLDLNRDNQVNVLDAQVLVNVILGTGACPS